jgi:hypothetical protein
MKHFFFLILILFGYSASSTGQSFDRHKADSLLNVNKEVYFSFQVFDPAEVSELSKLISIDNVRGNEIFAYANREEFNKFIQLGYKLSILTPPGSLLSDKELMKPEGMQKPSGPASWNFYPTYQQYLDTMAYFANAYPSMCRIDTIGTTNQGRLLLAAIISKDVNIPGAKPKFLYTSSIHGDELTGYVGMLHLIEYLLTNYGTLPKITRMVDSIEIYINPLANPDGTYHGGNNSVGGAIRGNFYGVDMNRNYPDPAAGDHPDGKSWQTETKAFMAYADSNMFTMSANFHGGAEVFNYPWDTWARVTADNSWWIFVGREFADTIHKYGPAGYFTFLQNGITDGYAWYSITGGRQDYMNYWHKCREVTIELSTTKLPPASQLLNFWNYDYHSYLNFIEQTLYGIHGIVTDTATGNPLKAKIVVTNHDIDSSFVYSGMPTGYYDRVIDHGTWELTFSKPGYYSKTISNINVVNYSGVKLDVQLKPIGYGTGSPELGELKIYPVPASDNVRIVFPEADSRKWNLEVINSLGACLYSEPVTNRGNIVFNLQVNSYPDGLYFIRLTGENGTYCRRIQIRH